MKRFFRIFAVAALACATFVACENKFDDYDPATSEAGAQVYFPSDVVAEQSILGKTSVTIDLMRVNSEAAANVPIVVTAGDEAYASLFTVPATAEFKAGAKKASITITFDPETLKYGTTYKLTLTINDNANTTSYGNNTVTLKLNYPEPFSSIGKGKFHDTWMFENEYTVEICQNDLDPSVFRLMDPYTEGLKEEGYTPDYVKEGPAEYVEFRILKKGDVYNDVTITHDDLVVWKMFRTGYFNTNYNDEVYVIHPSSFTSMATEDKWLYSKVLQWQDNGLPAVVQFAPMYYMLNNGGWNYTQNDGVYTITFPGVVLKDYSLALAYGGFRVAGDDETTYPVARVTFGADVAQVQYVFVEGDITADAAAIQATLAGMADGTIESTTVDAVDDTGEEMPEEDSEEEEVEQVYAMDLVSPDALGSGIYTVIALPINAEGEVITNDGDLLSFYNPGVGESEAPDVDMAVYAMSLEELEEYDESLDGLAAAFNSAYGLDATNSLAILAEGSEIAEWKVLPVETASIGKIIANGYTLDEYVLAMDAYYEANGSDLDMSTEYINADGWDYGVFNAKAGTSYTFLVYAKNAYGKEAMFYASAETEKAEATAKRKLVLHKLDGVELNRNFNNVEIR